MIAQLASVNTYGKKVANCTCGNSGKLLNNKTADLHY